MKVSRSDPEWKELLSRCRVALRQLGPAREVLSVASACMLMFKGRRILLTVQHAVKNQGNWAIEVAYRPPNGTQLYQLGPMNFFVRVSPGKRSKHIDLAYAELP